jgi:L-fuculose-phosphate aldolase
MTLPAGAPALQQAVAQWSMRLHTAGWVANHDGNISVRASDGERYYATPTALSKGAVSPHDVITVDIEGKILSGRRRLFSEWHLHKAVYQARKDVRVVMHAHPPFATAFAVARKELPTPSLPEMIVTLGARVPLIAFSMPKSATQDQAIARALTDDDADAFVIAGNGCVTVGIDLEQAYLRMELVEHWAKIAHASLALGGPVALSSPEVSTLLEARTKAGLGRRGRATT